MGRFYYLVACWFGIFLLVLGVNLRMPPTWWGALITLPVNLAVCPAACWAMLYYVFGAEAAREWWLEFRFVLANWNRLDILTDEQARARWMADKRSLR